MLLECVQYLRPDGRQRHGHVEGLSDDLADAYANMAAIGHRFEAEVLTTGKVSLTISNHDWDVDIQVVENGPQVIVAMEEMLRQYHEDEEEEEEKKPLVQ